MKKLAALLGVALLALSWAAVHLWQELAAQRERSGGQAAVHAGPAMPAPDMSGPGVGLTGDTPKVAAAQAADAPSRTLPAVSAEDVSAVTGMLRAMMDRQYPDVATALGLTPEETVLLFDLLGQQSVDVGADLMQAAGPGADPTARAAAQADIARKERMYEAELESLLGGKYGQWKEYQRTRAGRRQEEGRALLREQLRDAVSPPGRPIGDQRLQVLSDALEAEQRRIDAARRRETPQQRAQHLDEDRQSLHAVGSALLDAEEMKGYGRYLDERTATMRMMMGMLGATGGTSPPPAAGAASTP